MAAPSRLVGFIRPPPDIRAVVDKTAAFIGKMGDEFEARILGQGGADAATKFRFLSEQDPYHAYYRHKVAEARAGPQPAPAAEAASSSASASASSSSSSSSSSTSAQAPAQAPASAPAVPAAPALPQLPNDLARALRSFDASSPASRPPRSGAGAPAGFAVPAPADASPEDVERVRLAAQFTATGGRRFLAVLTAQEYRNPEFDFLRPSHAHFAFFTALVDAYARTLALPAAAAARVEALASVDAPAAAFEFLESAVHAAEWRRLDEDKAHEAAAAGGAGAGAAAAAIDWGDFVVVETIELADFEELAIVGESAGAGAGASAGADAGAEGGGEAEMETEVEMEIEGGTADGEEELNIRTDWVSAQAGATGAGSGAGTGAGARLYIDPISGLAVPIDAASEHMRIELLDPRWREQALRAQTKSATTLFAGGDEVAQNIGRLGAGEAKRPKLG
jgi:splicing factor 3A subunit 1